MSRMMDRLLMLLRGEAAPPPIATLIGFTLGSVEPGRAVIEFEADERHASPLGTCTAACWPISPMRPWAWPTPQNSRTERRLPPSSSRSTS